MTIYIYNTASEDHKHKEHFPPFFDYTLTAKDPIQQVLMGSPGVSSLGVHSLGLLILDLVACSLGVCSLGLPILNMAER